MPGPESMQSSAPAARPGVVRAIGAAVLATTAGSMPVYLMGGLAVQAAADTGIDLAQLGALAAVYFGSSALWSAPAGTIVERLGVFHTVVVAAVLSTVTLVGIAVFGRTVEALAAFIFLAGASNGIVQPAVNLMLARTIPVGRRGLAFGIKQAAVPLGSFLGGISVPLVGLTIGWRWAFAIGVLAPVSAVLLIPRLGRESASGSRRRDRTPTRHGLVSVALGAGLANGSTMMLGTFYVAGAVAGGIAPAHAGLLLSVGSLLGITTRIVVGNIADKRDAGHFIRVRWMFGVAAAGFVLLAIGQHPVVVLIGTGLAFAASWGWHGLLTYAVVVAHPTNPASATAMTQAGSYGGGVVGPIVFGVLSATVGFGVAWNVAAAFTVLGFVMVSIGERRTIDAGIR
jgi:MFS family permease